MLTKSRRPVRLVLLVWAVTGSMLITGCGGSSSKSGQESAQTSPQMLARAADISTSAPGFKAAITMRGKVAGKSIDVNGTATFSTASREGWMTMNMNVAGQGHMQLQAVMQSDSIYMKFPPELASQLPSGKAWVYVNFAQLGKAAGTPGLASLLNSTSTMNDPGQYLDYLRATSDGSVKKVGPGTVEGVETTHYHADVDYSKLPNVVPTKDRAATQQLVAALEKKGLKRRMPLDVWIDGSHQVRRITTAFSETISGQPVSVVMTENFLNYGPQPAPTIPSPSQTVNLLSLIHSSTAATGSATTTGSTTDSGSSTTP